MSLQQGVQDGWDYAGEMLGAAAGAQMGAGYIEDVDACIQALAEQINSKSGFATDPAQLKGFVAEDWHAGTFNLIATLRNSRNRAYVVGSTEHASVDIATNFGENYSLKYYVTGKASVVAQAKDVIQAYKQSGASSKMSFDEYLSRYGYSNDMNELLKSVYNGQGRIIPSDQLKDAVDFLKREIAKESMKDGINRSAVCAKYEETLSRLSDRIRDGKGIESIPLTKEEAEAIAALCKEGKFRPEDFGISMVSLVKPEYVLQQALKSGASAAIMTVVFELAPYVFRTIMHLIQEGEISLDDLRETGFKTLSGSAEGFLRGSVSSAITIAARSGQLGESLMNIDAGVVGAITFLVISTAKNSFLVASGKMTGKQMGVELSKQILISGMSLAGGTVGQLVLPELPVLGYMLGSLVGSLAASVVIFTSEHFLLAFCVRNDFTCWGLVEQNYELPPEVLQSIGYETAQLDNVQFEDNPDLERVELETAELETVELENTKDDFRQDEDWVCFQFLRRGVVGFYKVGYVCN